MCSFCLQGDEIMKNKQENQILDGPIVSTIIKLALPIATLSLMGFLYNVINMMFIGHDGGAEAAAAIGAGALIISAWFALMNLARVGAQVKVAQSLGEKNVEKARQFAKASVQVAAILALIIAIVSIIFSAQLIVLGGILKEDIIRQGQVYLIISAIGVLPLFLSNVMTGNLNGQGDTKATLYFNGIGLIINIVLDYIFIKELHLGIAGAAFATIVAQYITFICTYLYWKRKESIFHALNIFVFDAREEMKAVMLLGLPNAGNRLLFVFFSLMVAVSIRSFGDQMIGIQRIGIQVESITWMMSFGIAQALSTFIGQNFGAKKMDRVRIAYRRMMMVMIPYGALITVAMILFAKPLFGLFLPENDPNFSVGVTYLQILGASQLFMVLEIVTTGGFEGVGRTVIPSVISIVFTGLRVPASYLAISTGIGLNGIWWSISMSSIMKGILAFVFFIVILYRLNIHYRYHEQEQLATA